MKKAIKIISLVLAVVLVSLSVCFIATASTELEYDDGISDNDAYNSDYFYRNDNQVLWYADPCCIYVSEEEDPVNGGWFYIYGTTRKGNNALLGLRTKDFATYENLGPVLTIKEEDWPYGNLWAPEVIHNEIPGHPENEEYLMYFSANVSTMNNVSTEYDTFHLGVACSSSPAGPFVMYDKLHEGETNINGTWTYQAKEPSIRFEDHFGETIGMDDVKPYSGYKYNYHNSDAQLWAVIDASPFFDEDGQLYLYFVGHYDSNKDNGIIYGVKMLDASTPDYSTLRPIAMAGKSTITYDEEYGGYLASGDVSNKNDTSVNEGPYMQVHTTYKPDGTTVKKYYLTYSNPGYGSHAYSVDTAVSDSPLGDFVKIADLSSDDIAGNPTSGADDTWNHISGAGHHSICTAGDEMFIVYHTHAGRDTENTNPRTIDADRIYWTYDEQLGFDVYYTDGPTYSLQPIPEVTSGLTNVASEAYITATNGIEGHDDADLLNDNLTAIHAYSEQVEYRADGSVTITLKFAEEYEISSLFVYNSYDYDYAFDKLAKVTFRNGLKYYVATDVAFNPDYIDTDSHVVYPGSAAVMAFEPIKVKSITIEINSKVTNAENNIIGVGEIRVYGRVAE